MKRRERASSTALTTIPGKGSQKERTTDVTTDVTDQFMFS